jgi:hypothetical protein
MTDSIATPDREEILSEALGADIDLADLQRKMQDGFIVELTIKRWRARKKLSLYELGIVAPDEAAEKAYDELCNLGTNALLPIQVIKDLETIERLARQSLKNHSFTTPFGKFVPWSSYSAWKRENEEYKRRFFAKRDEIVANYEQHVEDLLFQYEDIARHSYMLLSEQFRRTGQGRSFYEEFGEEWIFVEHFRRKLIGSHIKTGQQFADTFVYRERFSKIQMFDVLNTKQERVTSPESWMDEQEMRREAAEKRRAALLEMEEDLVRQVRTQKQNMIDSFLQSMMVQLRTLTYDTVTQVLKSVNREETLQGRPAIQLKNLVAQLKEMNYYGDRDIDGILTKLYSIIDKPSKERDVADIQKQLRAIATMTRGTILALGDEDERSEESREEGADTQLGITAYPTLDEVREAREEVFAKAPQRAAPLPDEEVEREEREEAPEKPKRSRRVNVVELEREER